MSGSPTTCRASLSTTSTAIVGEICACALLASAAAPAVVARIASVVLILRYIRFSFHGEVVVWMPSTTPPRERDSSRRLKPRGSPGATRLIGWVGDDRQPDGGAREARSAARGPAER